MRNTLSKLIVDFAKKNEEAMVISGDHGYALFDEIRSARPLQFLNAGVMEQAIVGIAAGLAKTGHRPIVYGLAAFIPMRVLEQIKIDVCYSELPVVFLGDGAGLVYSTLGSSHQCGEDLACLRPLPGLRIFTPADSHELEVCFAEAVNGVGPAYIRIGKSDRPSLPPRTVSGTEPAWTHQAGSRKVCLVSIGSMGSICQDLAKKHDLSHLSISRIKPLHTSLLTSLRDFEHLIVIEEHDREGGLSSAVSEAFLDAGLRPPRISTLCLKSQFAHKCGSWQYALSEHDLSDDQIRRRVAALI